MCRPIWVLAIAPSDDACRRVRAFAGPDAQVVGTATDAATAKGLTTEMEFDVAVLDGRTADAAAIIGDIRATKPGSPIVWVGESAPNGTRFTVSPERLSDDLARAILRAVSAPE